MQNITIYAAMIFSEYSWINKENTLSFIRQLK